MLNECNFELHVKENTILKADQLAAGREEEKTRVNISHDNVKIVESRGPVWG